MKFSFRSLVTACLGNQTGIGVELFRLSDADADELTSEELDAAIEAGGDSSSDEMAVMRIYDEEFGKDSCATVEEFAEALDNLSDIKRLHLHINSRGGEVFAAQDIYIVLGGFNPRKIAYIDHVAVGAATIIMCACDEVIAGWNSSLIFCNPQVAGIGDADAMRKYAKDLEAITFPIVNVYMAQTGGQIPEREIRRLMADQTWMTAQDALKMGFITAVRGQISRD